MNVNLLLGHNIYSAYCVKRGTMHFKYSFIVLFYIVRELKIDRQYHSESVITTTLNKEIKYAADHTSLCVR